MFGNYTDYSDKPQQELDIPSLLKVVKASFESYDNTDWERLFEGYDYLYAITFSSGIDFANKVIKKFKYAEIIFGCENVMNNDFSAIMAMQTKVIQNYVKRKSAKYMAERLDDDTLKLYVSRDTKSHEKIFILSSDSGKTRVITGSANMSGSAFGGIQRENIICFDDKKAYEYYKSLYDDFREICADYIPPKTIKAMVEDIDYLEDNIQEIPIIKTIEDKKMIFLEETNDGTEEVELVASIKGFEAELKPMMPKQKKENGKICITGEIIKEAKRKYNENREIQKIKEKKLPKLHIDFETRLMDFNGKPITLTPKKETIKNDLNCLTDYFQGYEIFNGDYKRAQKSYFIFLNWYFASVFMPYLRLIAHKNNYDMVPFPVFGIIYGDSNGGKSTLTKLLSKLMCGQKVPLNSSIDFTSTGIEDLKRGREGVPVVIDDLAKLQFQNNNEKIIKDDEWGIKEKFINYPSVVITTNRLPSVTSDISKRAVTCHIDIKINKEAGARNAKRINESMNMATTAFFGEYVRIMFDKIDILENAMKTEKDYFPDIFRLSSETICEIFDECNQERPDYITPLSFNDYFGDKAVSKNAIEKILSAWENEPKQFRIDKKQNKLIYSCGENGNVYLLKYIHEELPPTLNAKLGTTNLVMDLDKAEELFGRKLKKKLFQ